MNRISKHFLTCLLLLCMAVCIYGQKTLFESDELIEIRLIMDIEAIQRARLAPPSEDDDPKEFEAQLIQQLPDGSDAITDLKVSLRGNFRRRPGHCIFPPLELDFRRKKDPPIGPFEGQNKLKLVTHCESSDYVHREYLVYKLYNLITEYSFQVRIAKITYEDWMGNLPPQEEYAFFIEDDDDLAERVKCEDIKDKKISVEELDSELLTKLHFFQCMIGNLDWDITLNKNIEILERTEDHKPIVIPYDFDFSQMVNAPYTNIGEMERQQFRKLCTDEEEIQRIIDLFSRKEDAIIDCIKSSDFVKGKARRECINTIKSFYDRIKDPQQVVSQVQGDCN